MSADPLDSLPAAFNWSLGELEDDISTAGFAYDPDAVKPVAPTSHLVVTPGDAITTESGFLRWVSAVPPSAPCPHAALW